MVPLVAIVVLTAVPILPTKVVVAYLVLSPPTISDAKLAVCPVDKVTTILPVELEIVTSSAVVGTTPLLQFVPVSHVPVAPATQVTAAAFTLGITLLSKLKNNGPRIKLQTVINAVIEAR